MIKKFDNINKLDAILKTSILLSKNSILNKFRIDFDMKLSIFNQIHLDFNFNDKRKKKIIYFSAVINILPMVSCPLSIKLEFPYNISKFYDIAPIISGIFGCKFDDFWYMFELESGYILFVYS